LCLDFPFILCYTNENNEELNASEGPVLRSENLSSEPNGSEDSSDSEPDSEIFLNDFNDLRSELVAVSELIYSNETYDLYSI
jgi:hypothetical protein